MNMIITGAANTDAKRHAGSKAGMRAEFNKIPENATPAQKKDLEKLKTLSKDYESFFMKEVVSAMRRTVPKDSNLDGGNAEEIYKSMLDDQLSSHMANKGSSGVAQELYNRLSKSYLSSSAANRGQLK